jgi:hypothetical protein
MSDIGTSKGIEPGRFKSVKNYRVWVGDSGNKSTIQLWYDPGTGKPALFKYLNLRPEVAFYIVDLLRNEKPIFLDPKSGELEVTYEPVGEGEI